MFKVFGTIPRRFWTMTGQATGVMVLAGLGALAGCGKDEEAAGEVKNNRVFQAALGDRDNKKQPDAPGFDGGIAWLNTAQPIDVEDLRGRIVLLDFWTLCCINCIHTLPDLAKLEAKYPGVLVVIGVHTPKFPNEKRTSSIRKAILRYQIKHPVVNDAMAMIWRRYGVSSWPTLVLIDPEGKYYGQVSGEGRFEVLDQHIGKLVKKYKAKKMLKETPLEFALSKEDTGPLCFPGKVLADATGKRLFIADSTNNRIVITDLSGKKIAVAGTGAEGKADGSFAKATFSDPQGMALDGNTLYVADRKNHLIRALDLKAETVSTIAGVGEQDREGRDRAGPALKTGLNSPWDLLLHDKKLYIAMAGNHQIWTLDLAKERVAPFAGNGREDIGDGPLNDSSFAQPSGLASDGKNLYVADSEISAIRALPLNGKGEVRTIVGEGLFDFGDVNGQGNKVRLQHALGVAFKNGKLYVADTYNSKIKLIDPEKRTCETFKGEPAGWLSPGSFNEPGGLSVAGNKLYVADTNAHRIRVIDMDNGAITTLNLQGVTAPKREK
jgi:DNA-binding beta-propeller fold protein YncE